MALTAKQEAFCQAVVSGMSQADAYRKAYDAERMKAETIQNKAHILMKNGEVRARVEAIRAPVVERAIEKAAVDKAWVMSKLVKVVDMGMQAEPVYDNDGAASGEYKQNLAAANKALELIGKELAMFIDRSEVRTGPLDGIEHEELKAIRDAIGSLATAGGPVPTSPSSTRH
jgi:phage terminase small subunit